MGATPHQGGPSWPYLRAGWHGWARAAAASLLWLGLAAAAPVQAQETVCARVKIEIKQELTLERQAFDAEMKINNTTDSETIQNVSVVVKITDELGTPVPVSSNPNDLAAKFFVRVSAKDKISDVDGTGSVAAKTTSTINWLIIPAPGSAGSSPLGKKYLVGATLKYRFGSEDTVLEVSPDVITVKPMPLLTLDYFLPEAVNADDPLTAEIEPVEPFTLGVRVKNSGMAAAKHLRIDSAQPKIVENQQGLLINFKLTGSYVDDMPAQNSLLIDFGDIAAGSSKMGRWNMETTLAGKFTEFTARFSHADELGGALTSLMQATHTHFLIRDVRVDLPGRDPVRDFLARDGDFLRVYESDSTDTLVTDRSAVAQLTGGTGGQGGYRLSMPATDGFVYARLPDPFKGQKALGQVLRSDAKALLPENAWLSKTRNAQSKQWEYWVNVFDVNTTGVYEAAFEAPPATARPPQVQFVPDRLVEEGKQVSFLVEASSPDGKAVSLSAAPLPAGASFTPQAIDPTAPGLSRAVFDWTPPKGAAGSYLIVYTATDGQLSASRSASIKVNSSEPPPGPGTPAIAAPASGTEIAKLRPALSVLASTQSRDPTVKIQFELYKDEAMTQLVASALVDKAPHAPGEGAGPVAMPTSWTLPQDLDDNTPYWWRARAFDGAQTYSAWATARFFVNLYNDPPGSFNLTSPAPKAEVASERPVLSWTHSVDPERDPLVYSVAVYRDAALTDLAASASRLPPGEGGSTSWTVPAALLNHRTYYWVVVAEDSHGAQTPSMARPFIVNTGNTAPAAPVIAGPAAGAQNAAETVTLSLHNSADAEGDLVTYVFELDTADTFDSGDKRSSGEVIQSAGAVTSWTVGQLLENKHYHWRVKAQDGRAESAWVAGDFLQNARNDAPPAPTVKNPGNGAWSATVQPTLEANAVQDPEGEAVRYQFEVYRDAKLGSRVIDGVATSTAWPVPVALQDKATHWWRVRSIDAQGATSAWGPATVLYVSTGPYSDPSIQMTAPNAIVAPEVVSSGGVERRQVTLQWLGNDPNIDPTVALYHSRSNSGYAGTRIVDGIKQPAGSHAGSHVWDVTGLEPGTYYLYAEIYDARGIGRAYAPGAVVIAPATPAGRIVVTAPASPLVTTEAGGTASFTVRLANAPTAPVQVPVAPSNPYEGKVTPQALTFTPANWSVDQTVTVTGQYDCTPDDVVNHAVITGKSVSLDPNYMGLSGAPVPVTNQPQASYQGGTTDPQIHVCRLVVVNPTGRYTAQGYEYIISAELTNLGPAVKGVNAHFLSGTMGLRPARPSQALRFGAVAQGETVRSLNTIAVYSYINIPKSVFFGGAGSRWGLQIVP
ncbi:hypothetical protein [Eleftheria terrae]|uniref:hypothetical protein n=1 Tax=Eleftheria terrae TaxID=1597781 RepID=UPI00263B8B6A|nr:hypothetical protein [Eleftheria terrae]WKB55278.1 hypothetical protein N7L95_24610 [Eleftheria terrae]